MTYKDIRILIAAVNSQFIHSSLAPWYLKAACQDRYNIFVREYSINDRQDAVLSDIYRLKPDVIAFSCYIWNVMFIRSLIGIVGRILPDTVIILGGPEVSYDCVSQLRETEGADFVISGEGDLVFGRLLDAIHNMNQKTKNTKAENKKAKAAYDVFAAGISGVAAKTGKVSQDKEIIYDGKVNYVDNLDEIPSPYTEEMLKAVSGKILYYESSRGCPFSCSYCLSSIGCGIRYYSLERVEADLSKLMAARIGQVKFVDRTFNIDRDRTEKILKFIIDNVQDTSFHFEISAELLDSAIIRLLGKAPEGLIQIEAGVQTTSRAPLEAVGRRMPQAGLFNNIAGIREKRNIHIHLDLIAGLPMETPGSFAMSFNDVYAMQPDNLQLGFLKILKGTKIRDEACRYGYVFKPDPPYEVLSSATMSYDDILELKDIEAVLERYHNSRRFGKSVAFLIKHYKLSPFEFYKELASFCREYGYLDRPVQSRQNYSILYEFNAFKLNRTASCREIDNIAYIPDAGIFAEIFNELLKYDFFASDNSRNPPAVIKRRKDKDTKKPPSGMHIEIFACDVLSPSLSQVETEVLIDYTVPKSKVTGLYKNHKISSQ